MTVPYSNTDFEEWADPLVSPDDWVLSSIGGSGGEPVHCWRLSTNVYNGLYGVEFQTGGYAYGIVLSQSFDATFWRGQSITVTVWARGGTGQAGGGNNQLQVTVDGTGGWTTSDSIPGQPATNWVQLSVTGIVPADATTITVKVEGYSPQLGPILTYFDLVEITPTYSEGGGALPARSLLRHRIAIALEDMLVPIGSEPTGAGSTTLTDTVNLRHTNNDALNGTEVYIYASTASAQGQSRWVEDYIASSSLVSVAAWTTIPGTDDNYEMHKRFRVKDYDEAIDAAHDVVRLQHLLPKVDESIILNNMVSNGLMATWASTAVATGWSGAARTGVAGSALTITQEGNIIYSRYYSAKLTTPAATTQTSAFYQVIDDFSKYTGRTIEVRAWVHCLTANRVRAFIQEGTGTPKYSSYHNGKGWNDSDDLYASTTLSDNLSGLTVGIAIAAGSQIDAYLGRLEAIAGRKIYEYDIPSGFVAIDKVEVEGSIHNVYNPISSNKDWEIIRDATKRLHIFNPIAKRGISIQGHGVRICGQRKATKPTADTDSVELNEKFVIAYACWYLLQRNLQPNEVGILNEWKRKADELRHQLTVSMQGKLVEVVG